MVLGVVGGTLATRAFRLLWKQLANEATAPKATDKNRDWKGIVAAAALEGAVRWLGARPCGPGWRQELRTGHRQVAGLTVRKRSRRRQR
jgi:Protein of unknown function (DUF4235)